MCEKGGRQYTSLEELGPFMEIPHYFISSGTMVLNGEELSGNSSEVVWQWGGGGREAQLPGSQNFRTPFF